MSHKKFTLPAITPSPSDLQRLVVRLIEHRDLTAVRPIFDELADQGRTTDHRAFARLIGDVAARNLGLDYPRRRRSIDRWPKLAESLMALFWHDLFDLTETLNALEAVYLRPLDSDAEDVAFRGLLASGMTAEQAAAASPAVWTNDLTAEQVRTALGLPNPHSGIAGDPQ